MNSLFKKPIAGKGSQNNLDLIDIINKIQDNPFGLILNLSLPQIVVVGCQGAGKSSVLENIIGREFLPRGSGVVTRRPTVVQLLSGDEEYAEFSHRPGQKIIDFNDVKTEIGAETNRNPGPEGFSSVPISLKIYSPKVQFKLTLVDLPGLIRNTVDDQPENSIEEVYRMVLNYISQPNSLILAVSPANQDIATSDALEIAKTVDPQRIRTIGVLTKLDLMDKGTDAKDILENQKIPLKRGYVGVLSRSQEDNDSGKDINYCLAKEHHFFANSSSYKHLAHRMGTPYLRETLHEQLQEHIRESLPNLKQGISQILSGYRKQLNTFNAEIGHNSTDSFNTGYYMIILTQKFIESFQIDIFGHSELVSIENLSAGAMINYKLCRDIERNFKLPEVPSEKTILTIIANLTGVRNCLSMSSIALETVAKPLLAKYIEPLNSVVDSISEILDSSAVKSSKVLDQYPNLKNGVMSLIRNSISKAAIDTKETLEKHVQAEMFFVNTYHEDFNFPDLPKDETFFPMQLWEDSTSNGASCSVPLDSDQTEAMAKVELNEPAKVNADILAKTVENYLAIQQKYIKDIAFKYTLCFLVKQVMDFVKTGLVATIGSLGSSAQNEAIVADCEKDFNKIQEIESKCICLEEALNTLNLC